MLKYVSDKVLRSCLPQVDELISDHVRICNRKPASKKEVIRSFDEVFRVLSKLSQGRDRETRLAQGFNLEGYEKRLWAATLLVFPDRPAVYSAVSKL